MEAFWLRYWAHRSCRAFRSTQSDIKCPVNLFSGSECVNEQTEWKSNSAIYSLLSKYLLPVVYSAYRDMRVQYHSRFLSTSHLRPSARASPAVSDISETFANEIRDGDVILRRSRSRRRRVCASWPGLAGYTITMPTEEPISTRFGGWRVSDWWARGPRCKRSHREARHGIGDLIDSGLYRAEDGIVPLVLIPISGCPSCAACTARLSSGPTASAAPGYKRWLNLVHAFVIVQFTLP